MRVRFTTATALLGAALIVLFAGCSGEPESPVEKLIGELVVMRGKVPMVDRLVVPKLAEHGEEAIAALQKKIEETPDHLQQCYSLALIRINAEPARFEACKQLLKHSNAEVRKHAVRGFAAEGAPDEAIELAMTLIRGHDDAAIRSVAIFALSYCDAKKFARQIEKTIRSATNDPAQMVREHAGRALDRMRIRNRR
ncbi:MAG: hypothetical protein HQ592_12615 [Planctomycetes bacterium]|nr:hypothetical protein [Planctomycetota bacterium]